MASNSFKEPPATTKIYFQTAAAKKVRAELIRYDKMIVFTIVIMLLMYLLTAALGFESGVLLAAAAIAVFLIPFSLGYLKNMNIPFAVNFNHPLMSDEPMGIAQVFVWLTGDKKWQLLQESRVRLVDNNLLGGYDLVYDDENYTRIGHFSAKTTLTNMHKRSLLLLNQAIVLAKLSNDDDTEQSSLQDDEQRRQREKQDSDLLQRSWLEEEKEIEVEGPLAKLLNRD